MFMRKTDADIKISIHALVKRATYDTKQGKKLGSISIHALVKRATSFFGSKQENHGENFNPRPREEGDQFIVVFVV